jgi:hypothetical protein
MAHRCLNFARKIMRRLEYYLKHCNWNAVRAELIRLMPEYEAQLNLIRAFKQAFYELKKTQPVPADTLFIHVYKDNVWAYLNESKYENSYLNEKTLNPGEIVWECSSLSDHRRVCLLQKLSHPVCGQ